MFFLVFYSNSTTYKNIKTLNYGQKVHSVYSPLGFFYTLVSCVNSVSVTSRIDPFNTFKVVTNVLVFQVYLSPGPHNREYNPFMMDRVLRGAFDDTTSLAWSSCSRILAVGSKDNTTR
jgi:periodic tryptophan protein 2